MNIAEASIITHSARLHNRLIHSRRASKRTFARISDASRYDHGCRTVLQRAQHLGAMALIFVAADKLSLAVDDPLTGSGHVPKRRQADLPVSAASFATLSKLSPAQFPHQPSHFEYPLCTAPNHQVRDSSLTNGSSR